MTPRDPRTDPRPGDVRYDLDGHPALRVLAVGDDVHAVYVKSGVEASWPWELWRLRMSQTDRTDWSLVAACQRRSTQPTPRSPGWYGMVLFVWALGVLAAYGAGS